MSKLLIEGATVVTMDAENHVYAPGDIICEDERLVYVGPSQQRLAWQPDRVIRGEGKVALPGFINAHTHAAMTLLRSYADDLALKPWLEEKIWPLEARLTPEAVYWGTLLACLEMLEAGVTTFADMYFYSEETAQAVTESGLRADLAPGLTGTTPDADKRLAAAADFVRRRQRSAAGRITARLGPHAPYTCPRPFLSDVVAAAKELGCGIHIHLAETSAEVQELQAQTGFTPVGLLHEILGREGPVPVLAAHCVHLSGQDMAYLKADGIGVAHNPGSNLKLASGLAPLAALLEAGVKVGLGTDGAASNNNLDVLEEARLAALLPKLATGDPAAVPARAALRSATLGGAEALGLESRIGSLEEGKQADLVLLDEGRAHLVPRHDVISRVVYSARAGDVDTVLVAGRILLEHGRPTTLDRAKILSEAQKQAEKLVG
ncbi:MAG TPA: amidohydrolase [Firmicutes bacterium]|nr:amidohydrolase [Gelria sp. Kuro-4]BCV25070.1 5-methylthioadenosine/S-adenosylhomocysteine deaminase [Gelria sp. Kuro-4]HHV56643.1 amidohydrolase [Bacillota bacterium]